MASSLIQFRTDEETKAEAVEICTKLGIDLQTYLRICIFRLVQENGIPFSMKLGDIQKDIPEPISEEDKKLPPKEVLDAYGLL